MVKKHYKDNACDKKKQEIGEMKDLCDVLFNNFPHNPDHLLQ